MCCCYCCWRCCCCCLQICCKLIKYLQPAHSIQSISLFTTRHVPNRLRYNKQITLRTHTHTPILYAQQHRTYSILICSMYAQRHDTRAKETWHMGTKQTKRSKTLYFFRFFRICFVSECGKTHNERKNNNKWTMWFNVVWARKRNVPTLIFRQFWNISDRNSIDIIVSRLQRCSLYNIHHTAPRKSGRVAIKKKPTSNLSHIFIQFRLLTYWFNVILIWRCFYVECQCFCCRRYCCCCCSNFRG